MTNRTVDDDDDDDDDDDESQSGYFCPTDLALLAGRSVVPVCARRRSLQPDFISQCPACGHEMKRRYQRGNHNTDVTCLSRPASGVSC